MTKFRGGQYYGIDWRGEAIPLGESVDRLPDRWICRRVVDYPTRQPPLGARVSACTVCGAAIAYNPARAFPTVPKVCMQCARVEPLPIEPGS